jgi:hypothetical protein
MGRLVATGRVVLLGVVALWIGLALFAASPEGPQTDLPGGRPSVAPAPAGQTEFRPLVAQPSTFGVSRPLSEIARDEAAKPSPVQSVKIREIKNERLPWDGEENETFRTQGKSVVHQGDGALQTDAPLPAMPAPLVGFDGVSQADNAAILGGTVYPPDTNGAVGPNHYVQTVNLLVGIYNKSGTLLIPKFKMSSLFASLGAPCGTRDDGDPVVLYDRMADRWLLSQFVLPNYPSAGLYYEEIAISQTGDPTGAYYLYCFAVLTNKMDDYPHFGIWPDGYYMTVHQFNEPGGSWAGQGVFAFNRVKMLAGDPTANFVYFDLYSLDPNIGGMLPADADGLIPPPAGAPNVFAYPLWTGWGDPVDGVRLYNFHVDWATPANSTFTQRPESPIAVAAYDLSNSLGRRAIPQPAPATATMNLDAIADRLMFRFQYRNFGGYESLISCQTVNVSATPATAFKGAVRYQQFKNASPGGAFGVVEQASYAPDADSRWMGSAACDWQGNLAVGYSVSSTATFPTIRYAGRLAGDPPNQLTQGEATLIAGTGVQRGTANRWGDYSALTLDPTDDATFWYTQEYYTAASQAFSTIGWLTRIGSFKFTGVPAAPKGALNVTVTNCLSAAPVPGASVSAPGGYFRTTDAVGLASFAIMTPASYTMTASKPGWTPVSGGVTVTNGGTATLNLCISAPAILQLGTVTAQENPGNGDGYIEAGEGAKLTVQLKNIGGADATAVSAVLTTSTPGVTLFQPATSAYANLVSVSGAQTNVTPYRFTLAPSVSCPLTIDFTLTVTYTGGTSPVVFNFSVPTPNAPPISISATLNTSAPPPGPGYTTATGTQSTRLSRSGVASACGSSKAYPGVAGGTATRRFQTFTFTTCANAAAPCVTVNLSGANAINLYCAAYSGSFDPTNLATNFKADAGSSGPATSFSFNLPAGAQTFVIDVNEVNAGGGIGTAYTLSVSGACINTCAVTNSAPVAIAQDVVTNVADHCSAAANVDNGSYDPDGPAPTLTQGPASPYPVGVTPVVLTATDTFGAFSQANATVTVNPIVITPATLPGGSKGVPYTQTLTATYGVGPYTWAVTGGTKPPGLNLSAGGVLSGTPTTNSSYSFTVTVTDSFGCQASITYGFTVSSFFFQDDTGRSLACINAQAGTYEWQILTGPGTGIYTGPVTIMNGGAKFVSRAGSANTLNITFDAVRKKATGYFIVSGNYSALSDSNTGNNTGGCP